MLNHRTLSSVAFDPPPTNALYFCPSSKTVSSTMSTYKSDFIQTIQDRGYLHQCTNIDDLDDAFKGAPAAAYIGFDCTAPSLHVGSLLPIMLLRLLQKSGHKPIVLMGGRHHPGW